MTTVNLYLSSQVNQASEEEPIRANAALIEGVNTFQCQPCVSTHQGVSSTNCKDFAGGYRGFPGLEKEMKTKLGEGFQFQISNQIKYC